MLCPPFSRVLINSYRDPVRMVIPGGGEILSCEGTTQGDPLAMGMYALAIIPLIRELNECQSNTKQVWYADDATGAGSCPNLKEWWDRLTSIGPKYGYFPKSSKCHLVVKPEFEEKAYSIFEGTSIHITTGGTRHLGAVIGSKEYREEFVADKVKTWVKEIQLLADIASTQPHAVYSALVHGVASRWSFVSRTIPDIQSLLQPLEDAIHQLLIPALTGRPPCSKTERDIFALPSRLGGLGILNPSANCQSSFQASVTLTTPLVSLITAQSLNASVILDDLLEAKKNIRNSNRLRDVCRASELDTALSTEQKRKIALAKGKGSSSWLTVLPKEEYGFSLNKGEFRDALHLCYGWDIRNAPKSCVCGSSSVDHALTCKRGGFPILRHNEIRDMTAKLLSEVCHSVATEPPPSALER